MNEDLETMRAIIREIATIEPLYETRFGDTDCIYCDGDYNPIDEIYKHEPTCVVTKARALVAKEHTA